MDLACMSPRACPSCWHYQAGRCELQAMLREALGAGPMARAQAALPLATA